MSETYAPVPGINDTQNIYEIFNWVSSTASHGLLWISLIWVIWVVALVGALSEGREFTRGLIFANFIGVILGAILTLLGWISQTWAWFFVVFLAISVFWHKLSN